MPDQERLPEHSGRLLKPGEQPPLPTFDISSPLGKQYLRDLLLAQDAKSFELGRAAVLAELAAQVDAEGLVLLTDEERRDIVDKAETWGEFAVLAKAAARKQAMADKAQALAAPHNVVRMAQEPALLAMPLHVDDFYAEYPAPTGQPWYTIQDAKNNTIARLPIRKGEKATQLANAEFLVSCANNAVLDALKQAPDAAPRDGAPEAG